VESEPTPQPAHDGFVDDNVRRYCGIFPLGLSRQRHPRKKRDRAQYQSLHVLPLLFIHGIVILIF
jgi:hypothetical protein